MASASQKTVHQYNKNSVESPNRTSEVRKSVASCARQQQRKELTHMTISLLKNIHVDYLNALALESTAKTVDSYKNDLRAAERHFGSDRNAKTLTVDEVQAYFDSPAVTQKRDGSPRNLITISKQRRTFSLALRWAFRHERIDSLPLPDSKTAKEPTTTVETNDVETNDVNTADLTPISKADEIFPEDTETPKKSKKSSKVSPKAAKAKAPRKAKA